MQTKRLMAFALAAAMTTSASTPVSALAAETPENVGGVQREQRSYNLT